MASTFLTAEWRKLAMANYAIDPKILEPYLPPFTELDLWNGNCYVSLVGFMFLNTKVKGFPIPFHRNFEEVNLRFYVRYNDPEEGWKRGVVFIKEIVPKSMITFVANTIYNEHYQTLPMRHKWEATDAKIQVEYGWKTDKWNTFSVTADPAPIQLEAGSEAEFITEHYWGYTKTGPKQTAEYPVKHPTWDVYEVQRYSIQVDYGKVYGSDFTFLDDQEPVSVLLAEGSEISVGAGRKI